ncbi:uncharacterized protein BDZ83DRAFT_643822 [Colletotrichum acutatum]|uniref:Uncharacterized protein n=1 Tax=Glomerella acutata TaxID=27357 RepID=A0AAD8XBD5_GLOAC|nr:uncharacterized protein BDZ83DRAFT_643822 [Colletotrichum acutatum]KAK1706112.1 hypothetical protein BDZ83DRAFT_643822 [Colletotrichum acutatum]
MIMSECVKICTKLRRGPGLHRFLRKRPGKDGGICTQRNVIFPNIRSQLYTDSGDDFR